MHHHLQPTCCSSSRCPWSYTRGRDCHLHEPGVRGFRVVAVHHLTAIRNRPRAFLWLHLRRQARVLVRVRCWSSHHGDWAAMHAGGGCRLLGVCGLHHPGLAIAIVVRSCVAAVASIWGGASITRHSSLPTLQAAAWCCHQLPASYAQCACMKHGAAHVTAQSRLQKGRDITCILAST